MASEARSTTLRLRRMRVAALLAELGGGGDQLARKSLEELLRLIEAARLEARESLEWRGARRLEARLES
ncbi:MAG: hypothetical protein GXO15_06550 [Crenarchaeota archaeon]|nr:hypothetical protein [Thermoproteota archaeon]